MWFTIRLDTQPGKIDLLDKWIRTDVTPFLVGQNGVKSVCVYHDALIGYPERTIMVEVDSLSHLEVILNSVDFKNIRLKLLDYGINVSSQLLDRAFCVRPEFAQVSGLKLPFIEGQLEAIAVASGAEQE